MLGHIWLVTFFCGKKSPMTSKGYNDAAGRGTGKNSAVKKRLEGKLHLI